MTILSCAAVSVEPLLKAHTDSLEALFASCKTLRLDSVKVRVAGGISPCVFFSGPNLKIWNDQLRNVAKEWLENAGDAGLLQRF